MNKTTQQAATLVSPARHSLSIPNCTWGWVKLRDLMLAAQNVASIHSVKLKVESQSDFIMRFCVLANLRQMSQGQFIFSGGKSVEIFLHEGFDAYTPPQFELDIYVPEGWSQKVLEVVGKGGTRVFTGKLKQPGLPCVEASIVATNDDEKNPVIFFA